MQIFDFSHCADAGFGARSQNVIYLRRMGYLPPSNTIIKFVFFFRTPKPPQINVDSGPSIQSQSVNSERKNLLDVALFDVQYLPEWCLVVGSSQEKQSMHTEIDAISAYNTFHAPYIVYGHFSNAGMYFQLIHKNNVRLLPHKQ